MFGKKYDKSVEVYSNIPLYLGKGKYSNVLTRDHILLLKPFPSDEIPLVLWDEIGMSANQYSYGDPNIMSENINDRYQCVETFIRLFRQFYGEGNGDACRIYATDQATGDVCINLRRRFGFVDNFSNFRRWLGFTPFFKVDVSTLMLQEDTTTNVNNTKRDKNEKQEYYFGWLPYRWMKKPNYDSHCFSGVKYTGFASTVNFTNWKDNDYQYIDDFGELHKEVLKTNYCPDLRMSVVELAQYKARVALAQKIVKDEIFEKEKGSILSQFK